MIKSSLKTYKKNLQKFNHQINNSNCKYTIASFINPIAKFDKSAVLEEINSTFEKFFYWEIPNKKNLFLGFDELINISSNGSARFIETSDKIDEIEKSFVSNYDEFPEVNCPLILGGMKFSVNDNAKEWSSFNDSDWFVPKFLILSENNVDYLIINWKVENHFNYEPDFNFLDKILSTRPKKNSNIEVSAKNLSNENFEKSNWIKNINGALSQIEKEHFSKIVISRKKDLLLDKKPSLSVLLYQLGQKNPDCYLFAYSSNESIFWGASPERLVKYDKNFIEADALAGSIARGKNNEEDEKLGIELLSSKKNRSEQKSVVDFIVSTFGNFSNKIEYPKNPVIKKFGNIQHLFTPIKAEVDSDFDVFELISSIHPTPAICGAPCVIAQHVISDLENYKRGLYSGVIGWLNFKKEGEFAVGIRSALLNDKNLVVFAGCGIVNGSDPEMEFNEAELKMVPILSLFDYDNSN